MNTNQSYRAKSAFDSPTSNPISEVFKLVHSLLSGVKGGKVRFCLSVFLAFCASGASVALMGTSAWLLSRAAEHPPVLLLQVAIVGVRFFGISRGVFRYIERLVGHDLALRMQGALRMKSYGSLSRTTLIGRNRGDLLVRVISDVDAVMDLVVRVAVPLCSASLVLVFTCGLLAAFNLPNALILLVTTLIAGLGMPALSQLLSFKADQSTVPARGEMGAGVRQISRAATDLVAYQVADQAVERYLLVDEKLRTAEARAAWARAFSSAGQMIATGVAVLAALLIGAVAVKDGTLAPTQLAVLVLVPLALHEVFADFVKASQTLTKAWASLLRVNQVLVAEPVGQGDYSGSESSANPSIQIHCADLGWPGEPAVLKDFSISVSPGEKVALTGRSGVGKTTVAATVMGLIPPLVGQVEVTGRVGYLAQNAHIFATSLKENVLIGNKDASDEQVAQALQQAGLDLPLDRIVGEDGATLSGGEAQRVALARVLVGHHDLWILDEPSEHLDKETADALMADLWRVTADAPMLVISHDPDVIARCDREVHLA